MNKRDNVIGYKPIHLFQEKLKIALEPLHDKLRILEEFKKTLHETAEHIMVRI